MILHDASAFVANVGNMIPDMGRYGVYIWSSYAITAFVLGGLFCLSLFSLRRKRRLLERAEQRGDCVSRAHSTRQSPQENSPNAPAAATQQTRAEVPEQTPAPQQQGTPEHV